jgi:thiol-disulfide isomerase/thioredoxin
MSPKNFLRISSVAMLCGASVFAGQLPKLWDASVVVNDVEIPFRFELDAAGKGKASGAFFNGDERVRSTSGTFDGGTLSLQFAHYATKLEAKWADGQFTGTYGRGGRPLQAFRAQPYVKVAAETGEVPSIGGQWEIAVKSPKGESAWRFFVRQSGPEVAATILRIDGDTGTLTGTYRGGKFVLSHFSGARPSLLEVTPAADGTLSLVQNGKTKYTAVKTSEARAKGLPEPADPSRWTSVQDPGQPLRFKFADLNGTTVSESDPRFHGKVVLVNITGSWCPNCHDEAPFLAELYRKYRKQGLEIVALSFEEAEQLQDPTRLRAFIKQYGIEYTVLVGGEPGQLKEKLPQAVNLNTWPATFFVGRDGLVRGSHAGFASKATGEEHKHLKAEFTATVEKLLAENIRTSR